MDIIHVKKDQVVQVASWVPGDPNSIMLHVRSKLGSQHVIRGGLRHVDTAFTYEADDPRYPQTLEQFTVTPQMLEGLPTEVVVPDPVGPESSGPVLGKTTGKKRTAVSRGGSRRRRR